MVWFRVILDTGLDAPDEQKAVELVKSFIKNPEVKLMYDVVNTDTEERKEVYA